jgi:hypothetical protein
MFDCNELCSPACIGRRFHSQDTPITPSPCPPTTSPSASFARHIAPVLCNTSTIESIKPTQQFFTRQEARALLQQALVNEMFVDCQAVCVFSDVSPAEHAWMWNEERDCWEPSMQCIRYPEYRVSDFAVQARSFCSGNMLSTCLPFHFLLLFLFILHFFFLFFE